VVEIGRNHTKAITMLDLPVMSVATGGSTNMVTAEMTSNHRRPSPTVHTTFAM